MARYPIGQPVRVSTTVRDVTGTLVNATTLTLTVKIAQPGRLRPPGLL